MATEVIEHFLDGLNLLLHPAMIKNSELQILENMEVRPTSISDTLTYLALTARSSYKRLHTNNLSFSPKALTEFISRRAGIQFGVPIFTGSGLNDMLQNGGYGNYTGTVFGKYEVTIDATGIPDTFKWRVNGGAYTSGVAITGAAQALSLGVTVTFTATTGHTLNDTWTFYAFPANTKYLITGGVTGGNLKMFFLPDGTSEALSFPNFGPSSTSTFLSLMPYNNRLYFSDGQERGGPATGWNYWDGVTAASIFVTDVPATKIGITHKNRAIFLNDVTNNAPNRMWVSDITTAATPVVGASNFFDVGDASDPIITAVDQLERILIIKENSTWAFYLAPTLSNSTLLRIDAFKGSISPRGATWGQLGSFVSTADDGINLIEGIQYQPSVPQVMNFLKGFQNTNLSLGMWENFLLITTRLLAADTYNKQTFLYNIQNNKVYKYLMNLGLFCQNKGILTFNKRVKAIEDDGSNYYIVELDQLTSTVESNISCAVRTKEFDFKDISRQKFIESVTIDCYAPNTSNAVTLKTYADGTLVNTQTWTPTATGYQRHMFDMLINEVKGNLLSFRIEYTQPASSAAKFALFRMAIDYDFELRAE
jgi:hypothetical protein